MREKEERLGGVRRRREEEERGRGERRRIERCR